MVARVAAVQVAAAVTPVHPAPMQMERAGVQYAADIDCSVADMFRVGLRRGSFLYVSHPKTIPEPYVLSTDLTPVTRRNPNSPATPPDHTAHTNQPNGTPTPPIPNWEPPPASDPVTAYCGSGSGPA
jgi:hypothetical protein